MARTRIRLFASHAHLDRCCCRLLEQLRLQMAPSTRYDFQLWDDRAILSGEDWEAAVMRAISDCDLGLLLVSPAFLGSRFITDKELPRFLGNSGKPAIPVEVETVNVSKHDMRGLQQRQIFRLDRVKPFGHCSGGSRTRFVEQLYGEIELRLERLGF